MIKFNSLCKLLHYIEFKISQNKDCYFLSTSNHRKNTCKINITLYEKNKKIGYFSEVVDVMYFYKNYKYEWFNIKKSTSTLLIDKTDTNINHRLDKIREKIKKNDDKLEIHSSSAMFDIFEL